MSLTQLKSQIEELRAQVSSIQKRSSRTKDSIANDRNLSEQGRQAKLDAERDRTREQLRGLKRKETELINTKKQTLEWKLFGLSNVTSSDPAQVLLYRDSQDRAARLARSDEAQQVFAAALRSDDKTLAAAVHRRDRTARQAGAGRRRTSSSPVRPPAKTRRHALDARLVGTRRIACLPGEEIVDGHVRRRLLIDERGYGLGRTPYLLRSPRPTHDDAPVGTEVPGRELHSHRPRRDRS